MEVIPPAQTLPAPHFLFKSEALSKGTILVTNDLEVGYDRVLLPPINLKINADEKIVISGFNGIGKSTLIKTLVGQIPPLGGEFH
jgi:ATPase subunit of ABC transporter with duplicated ATPase domains